MSFDPSHPHWVPGAGASPADIAFVGEAPGWEEVEDGLPFTGVSGQILWQIAAREAHLTRGGLYVTNWRKVPFVGKKEIGDDEPDWTDMLMGELRKVHPSVVVTLGAYSTRALLGDWVQLYWANGIPFRATGSLFEQSDWRPTVVPIVHPAAGLHQPDMLQDTVEGFRGLRRYLRGDVYPRVGWTMDTQGTYLWLPPVHDVEAIGVDTEGTLDAPYCITINDERGTWYIMASDRQRLDQFRVWVENHHPVVYMHNALYDVPMVRKMTGLDLWQLEVRDTMVMSFNLQNLPKDLKGLTKRELGVEMREYADVVRPWQEKADEEWRGKLGERVWQELHIAQKLTPKGRVRMSKGKPVSYVAGPELPLSIFTHLARAQQLKPNEVAWAEAQIGARPGMDLSLVPFAEAMDYAGRDARVTRRLGPMLMERVRSEGLEPVFALDSSVLPLIGDMQETGMHLDMDRYHEVMSEISLARIDIREKIVELVESEFPGHFPDFNPGSGDQVAEFCRMIYKRDGLLQLTKMTKSGARESVDDSALSMVREEHPFIDLELEYKELEKYEGTYLLPMGGLIKPVSDGYRLFPNIRATSVVSGRLSAHTPNVLAWPARTKRGLALRSIFTAPPGKMLVSWDLSQIELRLAAAFSKDPVMTEAFTTGRDLHAILAAKVFQKTYEECLVDPGKFQYRYPAKTIHYGLLYGMMANRLFEELRAAGITSFTREDCERLLDETWRVYEVAGGWLHGAADEARRYGYVSDFLGRRRYLPAVSLVDAGEWKLRNLRLEAERQAGNFKIQAAASELLKRSMASVWEVLYPRRTRWGFRLWLQIHDELIGEIDAGAFEEVNSLMGGIMTQDSWLLDPIPIETSGQQGANWGLLK